MTVRADQRRNDENILVAAAGVLARDPSATIQSIATAAGVSRLSVYRRYPDRGALTAGIRTAVDASLHAALDDFAGWAEGRAALRALIGALAEVVWRYPVVATRPLREPDAVGDDVRGDVRVVPAPTPDAVDARIEVLIADAQRQRIVRADLPVGYVNRLVFAALAATWQHGPATSAHDAADLVFAVVGEGVLA